MNMKFKRSKKYGVRMIRFNSRIKNHRFVSSPLTSVETVGVDPLVGKLVASGTALLTTEGTNAAMG